MQQSADGTDAAGRRMDISKSRRFQTRKTGADHRRQTLKNGRMAKGRRMEPFSGLCRWKEIPHGDKQRRSGAALFLQAVHNNYSEGIETIAFARDGEDLNLYVREGEKAYTIRISQKRYQMQKMSYHQEEYEVAAKGETARNEDGILVLKISLAFLETPHSRRIKCFFYDGMIRIGFEEEPGLELIQDALASVTKTGGSVFVQGLFAKLDPEYVKYKIKDSGRNRGNRTDY